MYVYLKIYLKQITTSPPKSEESYCGEKRMLIVQVPPNMPAGRNHAASCTDGNKFYIFGGRIGGNTVGVGFDDTQIYTPGQGWASGAPVPLARAPLTSLYIPTGLLEPTSKN